MSDKVPTSQSDGYAEVTVVGRKTHTCPALERKGVNLYLVVKKRRVFFESSSVAII